MKIIICDDSLDDRKNCLREVNSVAKECNIDIDVLEYETAKQLLFDLEEKILTTDILLFDINMPEMSGIEAAQKLRNMGYKGEIVFLTVSKNHMLNAFDVRAFNYIIKGEMQNDRVKKILKEVLMIADEKSKEYILFTGIGEIRNIPVLSIKYFEVKGKIVTVYYGSKSFEFVSTIGKLENILFTRGFIRVHRSFMVSTVMIKSFSYEVITLIDGTLITVGRKYYARLKEDMLKKSVNV